MLRGATIACLAACAFADRAATGSGSIPTRSPFITKSSPLVQEDERTRLRAGLQQLRGGGATLSRLLPILLGRQQCRILMVGLDAAGKTTILYQLKLGEMTNTAPTLGFNVETVTYKNIEFMVWDMGGQDAIRPLWRHYYENAQALIFVVDSADAERLHEAREELAKLMEEEELRDAVLLIYANKQVLRGLESSTVSRDLCKMWNVTAPAVGLLDSATAAPRATFTHSRPPRFFAFCCATTTPPCKQDMPEAKSVQEVADALDLASISQRIWYIQACSASSGEGITDGLDWLAGKLAARQRK